VMDVMGFSSPHVRSFVFPAWERGNSAKGRLKLALASFYNRFLNEYTCEFLKTLSTQIQVLYLELGNSSGSLGLFISTRR